MGSKLNPGKFDCMAAALPDEPTFTLLARDPLAAFLTGIWGQIRAGYPDNAKVVFDQMLDRAAWQYAKEPDTEKAEEALDCSRDMFDWRATHPKPPGGWPACVVHQPTEFEVIYSRNVGTAEEPCWVMCAKGDPGATAFIQFR